jgi:hypothetical protein
MLDNYGTDPHFQSHYRLTPAWIAARKEPFQTSLRLWLSDDDVTYYGFPTFRDEVRAFAERLWENDMQFMLHGGVTRTHTWTSGWLAEAVAGLHEGQPTPPSPPTAPPPGASAHDDFNRADGPLGPNWRQDPWWGSGSGIVAHAVTAPAGSGGAYYWAAQPFGADQYSQITLTGEIGVWSGVVVRGRSAPRQGYWVAIKADGAHLYAFVHDVFYELVHDPTVWEMGDVVRLEVQTVAPEIARLTLRQNGVTLVTLDEGDHFLAQGQPGLGLYALDMVALDAWAGGELAPTP